MDKLRTDEWLLSHIANYYGLSYSRVRGIISGMGIKPKRYMGNAPVFRQRDVMRIEERNKKPGPKPAKKNEREK